MSAIEEFRPGLYRHYKGPLYQALFLAHDANADTLMRVGRWDAEPFEDSEGKRERVVVVYIALELDQAHTGVRPAVRTLEDWNAWLDADRRPIPAPGGALAERTAFARGCVRRFEYVGAEYRP